MSSVDTNALEQLASLGGPDLVTSMVGLAIAAMRNQVAELLQAADTGDVSGVENSAHSLISSSGSVGAADIAEAARAIEARAASGLIDPGDPDITGLGGAVASYQREVQQVYP